MTGGLTNPWYFKLLLRSSSGSHVQDVRLHGWKIL